MYFSQKRLLHYKSLSVPVFLDKNYTYWDSLYISTLTSDTSRKCFNEKKVFLFYNFIDRFSIFIHQFSTLLLSCNNVFNVKIIIPFGSCIRNNHYKY